MFLNIPYRVEDEGTHQLFSTMLDAWRFCRTANIDFKFVERINWKNWGIDRAHLGNYNA